MQDLPVRLSAVPRRLLCFCRRRINGMMPVRTNANVALMDTFRSLQFTLESSMATFMNSFWHFLLIGRCDGTPAMLQCVWYLNRVATDTSESGVGRGSIWMRRWEQCRHRLLARRRPLCTRYACYPASHVILAYTVYKKNRFGGNDKKSMLLNSR